MKHTFAAIFFAFLIVVLLADAIAAQFEQDREDPQ
ncbi:hypothetical protein J2S55_009767 [Streptosporangium brasiliense]|uniref:Uncharacterized protein n=1 Tax=Streptosporangium brasiliense TaxID=47480 RepID=A0ABT9RMA2_9ACTN|nr:hypothetical protein [Streptosporangium brasiliense]